MHHDAGMFTTLRVALSGCLGNGTSVMHMIVADKDGPSKSRPPQPRAGRVRIQPRRVRLYAFRIALLGGVTQGEGAGA